MIKSMTAYGRGEWELDGKVFTCEIRTVNHRYRDIHLRLPKNFQPLEEELKALIAARIGRGRVEASLQVDSGDEQLAYHLELNEALVKSYMNIFEALAQEFGVKKDVSLDTLCQMKDVIIYQPDPPDLDHMRPALYKALEMALDSLDSMRAREGENIEADFRERLDQIENVIQDIERLAPQLVDEYRANLREKITRLLQDVELDEARLAQEVAYFAERSDITEEIVRTKSHLAQFREYLSANEPIGRRLDFLLQEINREVNTLSTKAANATISKMVVEVKGELERLREQAQNVE